jgi:hypothetical protein
MGTMARSLALLVAMVFLLTAALGAQSSQAPVLITPPSIVYPPIARVAHITGKVVVTFSIDSDGHTTSVQSQAGPDMLRAVMENRIKAWQFKTPLPIGAQDSFVGKFTFGIESPDDTIDDIDGPPIVPCCGDSLAMPLVSASVTSDVRSVDGTQTIEIEAAGAPPAADRCPDDKLRTPPTETTLSDYVELRRTFEYRVRVFRNGEVLWWGGDGVAAKGDRDARLDPTMAEALLTRFQTESFWSACSVEMPPDPKAAKPKKMVAKAELNTDDAAEDENDDVYGYPTVIIVRLKDTVKIVNVDALSFPNSAIGEEFAWAIEKAADTHRWRHEDAAIEPFTNMQPDLLLPKPGVTPLIRAVWHFDPGTWEISYKLLKKLLANGAEVDAADASGWTALMYAARLSYSGDEALKLLLAAQADPNHASVHGDTALMVAAYDGQLNETLLAHGADINHSNAAAVTTLMLLSQYARPAEIQDALNAGADVSEHDLQGRTALDYLLAAACNNAIVPLPKPQMVLILKVPPPCPPTTSAFLQSQKLLVTAMAAAVK